MTTITYLLHYPAYGVPPVGIWWWGMEGPTSEYLPGNAALQVLGNAALMGVPNPIAWDYTVDRLSGRTPNDDGYEQVEFAESVPPEQVLKLCRRAA